MSMQAFTKNLDKHYYKHAEAWKNDDGDSVPPLRYLAEDLRSQHGVYPEADEVKAFQQKWLKRLNVHPSEIQRHEKVMQYAADRCALEKVWSDAGCPMSGPLAPTVQKAFTETTTQVLFPFFYDTNIVAGILASPVLDQIIAMDIMISSHTADHLEMTETEADAGMGEVGEGTRFPEWEVRSTNRPVSLRKFAGLLKVTYEAVRLARLPLLARFLERAGRRYANLITDYAIETLIAGDGAGAGAAATVAATVAGTPVYSDLVRTEMAFGMGYTPNTIIAPKELIQKLLLFPEFKDPLAGVLHQVNGTMPLPVGMNLVRWDVTGRATSFLTSTMIMLDNSIALVGYSEGGMLQESDRIIDGQWERTALSSWRGFATMDRAATRVGTSW